MKKFLFILVFLTYLGVSLTAQMQPVFQINLHGKDAYGIIDIGAGRYIIEEGSMTFAEGEKHLSMVENGQIKWSLKWPEKSSFVGNICKIIGQEGVAVILSNHLFRIDYSGSIIDSQLLVEQYVPAYLLTRDESRYYMSNTLGGLVSDIFIYDSNLQLMNRTRRDGNITQIVADEDYLYFTSFQYNNESVNVILSKLTKDALATVWEVTLPDLWWGSMSINSEGIYHGARRRVHKPDISGDLLFDGWAVTKLDKSGNILWEKSEPGVPPLINDMDLSTVAINSIAAVPGGGCLVAGRKKIFNTPYTSSRQAMIAFVDNGEIVWQDSFKVNTYTTNANGIILDNENYALTILNDDAGSYLTKYKIDGITSVTDSKVMPTHLYLSQNYPNPFNPSTKISFVNPSADHVNLTVYDFLGREVTTLVDEVLPAGQKDIEFQASNLASGIYFYRLTSGTRSEFKKMILLK